MKKAFRVLFFILFSCFTFSTIADASEEYEKDQREVVKSLIASDAHRNGYDGAAAARAFDAILDAFHIKAVLLLKTKTGMNHYDVFKRVLRINVGDSTQMFEKIVGELTHAVQFTRHPVRNSGNAVLTFGKTFLKAVFSAKRERYRSKIDSIRLFSPQRCSKLRAAFIGIYLVDAYTDPRSFESEHSFIDDELCRIYVDLMFVSPHLSSQEMKAWMNMRKKQLYRDLRQWRRSFLFGACGTIAL